MGMTHLRNIERRKFSGPTSYMHSSPRDAVVERRISGTNTHPYHQHTWPYQFIETPKNAPGGEPYFKSGDWHDTYLNPFEKHGMHAVGVRFKTVDYHGPMVVHCHTFLHTDQGMMAVERVEGWGTEQCGCDLLDQPSQTNTELRGSHGAALDAAAGVAFILMLGLGLGLVLQLRRAWRAGAAERAGLAYSKLSPGPQVPA